MKPDTKNIPMNDPMVFQDQSPKEIPLTPYMARRYPNPPPLDGRYLMGGGDSKATTNKPSLGISLYVMLMILAGALLVAAPMFILTGKGIGSYGMFMAGKFFAVTGVEVVILGSTYRLSKSVFDSHIASFVTTIAVACGLWLWWGEWIRVEIWM